VTSLTGDVLSDSAEPRQTFGREDDDGYSLKVVSFAQGAYPPSMRYRQVERSGYSRALGIGKRKDANRAGKTDRLIR
jgi:hypothetical protein